MLLPTGPRRFRVLTIREGAAPPVPTIFNNGASAISIQAVWCNFDIDGHGLKRKRGEGTCYPPIQQSPGQDRAWPVVPVVTIITSTLSKRRVAQVMNISAQRAPSGF